MHQELAREDIRKLRDRLRSFAPVENDLKELASLLISPASNFLQKAETLVIVPHKSLYEVPFAL